MGFSKLNVWIRDEKCRPFVIKDPSPGEYGDWVQIRDCSGNVVKREYVSAGQAHVEMEAPPGCYIVEGHVCEPGTNRYTDKAIVMVGCNQELCVNLIVPSVKTCARDDAVAMLDAAVQARLDRSLIDATARAFITIGEIDPKTLLAEDLPNVSAIIQRLG